MTYWALNAVFLVVVVVVAALAFRRVRWAAVGVAAALLLVTTAVFDNVMIAVGLVDYAPSRISGVFVGAAPLEDFAYAIAAVVGLPALWSLLRPAAPARRIATPPLPKGEKPPDA